MEIVSASEDYQPFLQEMISEHKSLINQVKKFKPAVAGIGSSDPNKVKLRYARET